MNCPVCSVELRLAERQGIEIDYCPQCRGIWLDRGELDKIIERSDWSHFEGSREESQHHEPYKPGKDGDWEKYERSDPKKRKRGGILGDLLGGLGEGGD